MGNVEELLEHIEKLKRELARRETESYCQNQPFAAQKKFLELDCLEALYGGSAGSGKSDALLMAALQYVDRPGYNALILRRTYRDLALPGAIMDRAHEWLRDTDAHWNGIDKCWLFPSGAKLQFGYLDTEVDKYRYQGSQLQAVFFDELTQFQESQYVYLLSRIRRLRGVDIPLRVRSATNPGGLGHDWVKRRFVDEETRESRVFVPAKLADNTFLDQESYRTSLQALDSITRRQLLDGEWVRDLTGLVYRFAEERNGITTLPTGSWQYLLGIDFGIDDHTAFTIVGWRQYDAALYVVESWGRSGIIPSEAAQIVKDLDAKYKFTRIIGDTGGMGKAFTEEMRRRYHIPVQPADKQNKIGYISLLNGQLEESGIKVHTKLAAQLISEWASLPWHASHTKEHDGYPNHCSDATLYAVRAAYSYLEKEAEPVKIEAGSAAHYAQMERALEERAQREWDRQQDDMSYR